MRVFLGEVEALRRGVELLIDNHETDMTNILEVQRWQGQKRAYAAMLNLLPGAIAECEALLRKQ